MNEFVNQFHISIIGVFFVVALYILAKATDKLIESAVFISLKLGISQMIVGATVVSLGPHFPKFLHQSLQQSVAISP